MVFVGAAVLPHGTLIYDGDPESFSEATRERRNKLPQKMKKSFETLYRGCCDTADVIAGWDPELIILHSPHGITLQKSTGIYFGSKAVGTAEWNDNWGEYAVSLESDTDTAKLLLDHLTKDNLAAEGITCFWDSNPLRWAEVVPMWYILRKLKKQPKVLIITASAKRAKLAHMDEGILRLGRSLASFVTDCLAPDLRTALIISGDLSHKHSTDCTIPLYLPDPRSVLLGTPHESATEMDRALCGWAKGVEDFSLLKQDTPLPDCAETWQACAALPWLDRAASLNQQAYACGIEGFILLQSFMQIISKQENIQLKPCSFTYESPTYYGMMTVAFCNLKSQ